MYVQLYAFVLCRHGSTVNIQGKHDVDKGGVHLCLGCLSWLPLWDFQLLNACYVSHSSHMKYCNLHCMHT